MLGYDYCALLQSYILYVWHLSPHYNMNALVFLSWEREKSYLTELENFPMRIQLVAFSLEMKAKKLKKGYYSASSVFGCCCKLQKVQLSKSPLLFSAPWCQNASVSRRMRTSLNLHHYRYLFKHVRSTDWVLGGLSIDHYSKNLAAEVGFLLLAERL